MIGAAGWALAVGLAAQSEGAALGEFGADSVVAEKKLLLRESPRSSLPPDIEAQLEGQFDLRRFDVSLGVDVDPLGPEVLDWCDEAAARSAVRMGLVDGEGAPIVTLEAKLARCSQVFAWTIHSSERCDWYRDDDGDRHARCEVKASARIRKYRAVADARGIRMELDPSFRGVRASPGHITLEASNTATAEGNDLGTKRRAMASAASDAGRWLWLEIMSLPELQIRAPVEANRGGYTYSCLGKDTVGLDQPFIVFEPGTEREVGFVKARHIYDGCTQVDGMSEEAQLRPMEAENILGGGSIAPGMNLRELPSLGLAVGFGGGVAPRAGLDSPAFGIRLEQSLAGATGVSELHVAAQGQFAVGMDGRQSGFHVDLGLLKRWYLLGPVFGELSGYLTGSLWDGERDRSEDFEVRLENIGVTGVVGLGVHFSPTVTGRLLGGYRAAAGIGELPDELGPVASFVLSFGI